MLVASRTNRQYPMVIGAIDIGQTSDTPRLRIACREGDPWRESVL